jgi:FlaA1/EpsC-like NDP-sugar epimerase
MEDNPSEAVLTNVLGTKIVAEASLANKVSSFVFISTDKAVNPTNVMGATKRVAELYTQTLDNKGDTAFITTRFGNVLGSNGSVIPLFKKQIDEGGPVTVTDKGVSRYFMTIPEAAQLVLEAGAMGTGGEIFVFDMGESILIHDLAKNMIKLSGLELGKDIEIQFIGLRPGEKLQEELLANEENNLPTHHPKILKAKHQQLDMEEITKAVNSLIELFQSQDNESIVRQIKHIVPEYLSHNSIYSNLDT